MAMSVDPIVSWLIKQTINGELHIGLQVVNGYLISFSSLDNWTTTMYIALRVWDSLSHRIFRMFNIT